MKFSFLFLFFAGLILTVHGFQTKFRCGYRRSTPLAYARVNFRFTHSRPSSFVWRLLDHVSNIEADKSMSNTTCSHNMTCDEEVTVLTNRIKEVEDELKIKRNRLHDIRNSISDSGKNGCFMIQGKVSNYLRAKKEEHASRVASNRREFIELLLPIIDQLHSAPLNVPAVDIEELQLHANLAPLLKSIEDILAKYQYKPFTASIGQPFDSSLHSVPDPGLLITNKTEVHPESGLLYGDLVPTISQCTKPGVVGPDMSVLRKAEVLVGWKQKSPSSRDSNILDTSAEDAVL